HRLPSAVASERPHLSRLRRHQLMAHPTCTDEAETVPVEDGYRAKRRRRTSGPLSIGGSDHHRVEGALDRDERLDDSGYGVSTRLRCVCCSGHGKWLLLVLRVPCVPPSHL